MLKIKNCGTWLVIALLLLVILWIICTKNQENLNKLDIQKLNNCVTKSESELKKNFNDLQNALNNYKCTSQNCENAKSSYEATMKCASLMNPTQIINCMQEEKPKMNCDIECQKYMPTLFSNKNISEASQNINNTVAKISECVRNN